MGPSAYIARALWMFVAIVLSSCVQSKFGKSDPNSVITTEDGPDIELSSPVSSPSADPTPTFRVTLAGSSVFADGDILEFYIGTNCNVSGTLIKEVTLDSSNSGSNNVQVTTDSGTFTDGDLNVISVKVIFDSGDDSVCSSTSASLLKRSVMYKYDSSLGPSPIISLNSTNEAVDNVAKPKFDVHLSSGSFSTGDVVELYETSDCSGSAVATATATGSGSTLTIEKTDAMTSSSSTTTFFPHYVHGTSIDVCSDAGVEYRYVDYNLSNSTITVSAPSVVIGSSPGTLTVNVQIKDSSLSPANLSSATDLEVIVFAEGGTSTGTFSDPVYVSNGLYRSTFTPSSAGTATTVRATIQSVYIEDPTIDQITVQTVAAPVAPTTFAMQSPTTTLGNSNTPTIRVSGGGVASPGIVNLYSDSTCSTPLSSVVSNNITDNGSADYADVTTSALPEGTTSIFATVSISGNPSLCSTAAFSYRYLDYDLSQSSIAISSSVINGSNLTATLSVKNAAGVLNPAATGLSVVFSLSGTGTVIGSLDPATQPTVPDGTYSSVFRSITTGTRSITATINGQALVPTVGNPLPSVTVTPANVPVTIARVGDSSTTATSIDWTVTFDSAMSTSTFTSSDILNTAGTTVVGTWTVTPATPTSSTVFTITATNIDGPGMIVPQLAAGSVDQASGSLSNAAFSTSLHYVEYQEAARMAFTKIASGENHACGLTADGKVYCWGDDSDGQLGNGSSTSTPQNIPVLVSFSGAGLDSKATLIDVAVGKKHSCALASTGAAYCWGSDASGELGDTASGSQTIPNPVTAVANVTFSQISAKEKTTCALGSNGDSYCWGDNSQGQIGNSVVTTANTPTAAGGAVLFKKVDAGGTNTCALSEAGAIYCWGLHESLGRVETTAITSHGAPGLVVATNPTAATFIDVAAGGNGGCGITSSGDIRCWGLNASGEVGDNSTTPRTTAAVPVDTTNISDVKFTQISMGPTHTCALSSTGAAYCWGSGNNGELGIASSPSSVPIPTLVSMENLPTGVGFIGISASYYNTCAIATNGKSYCWGSDADSQLGNGSSTAAKNSPVGIDMSNVTTGTAYVKLFSGYNHSCALRSDFKAYCWGSDSDGQLGNNGAFLNQNIPTSVNTDALDVGEVFTKLALGKFHSCGLSSFGKVYCWGNGTHGELGNGLSTTSGVPVAVDSGGETFKDITVGKLHSCAIGANGKAYCWGSDSSGQMGNGASPSDDIPVEITAVTGFISIAAGEEHTCGITSLGTGYCWGADSSAQIGNGATSVTQTAPVAITMPAATAGKFKSVDAGGNYNCAITSLGQIFCWGLNSSQQSGNATVATNPAVPTVVVMPIKTGTTRYTVSVAAATAAMLPFTSVNVGESTSCATANNGKAYCWGENTASQVGNGATTDTTAVEVSMATTALASASIGGATNTQGLSIVQMAAGSLHNAAMSNKGMIYTWGTGTSGQMGNSTNDTATTTAKMVLNTGLN